MSLAHIDLWRGGRHILRDLSWRIRAGQCWVLLGDNGAGKTQLLKLIAGDVWPQPRPHARRAYEWRGARNDEPQGIKEEIAYLGAERQDRFEHYRWDYRAAEIVGAGLARSDVPLRALTARERQQVTRLLQRMRIDSLATRRFLDLSQGERRLVLLVRALASKPALLLLDEPLNGLDAVNRQRVLAVLARVAGSGLPWIYATHRPEEAPASATHRALLQDGRLRVGRWRRGAAQPAVNLRSAGPGPGRAGAPPGLLLELRRATVWRGGVAVLRSISMRVHAGECWVVHGANGSGKSTLLATLHGDHGVASTGSIVRPGHRPGQPLHELQRRTGRVSPDLQAMLPRAQSAQHCVVAALRGAIRLDGAPREPERRAAAAALRQAGALPLARRAYGVLSYGQARRVLFARALAARPDILLLDEPYAGLDAPTRTRMIALVARLCAMRRTILIATHHADDWPRQATHELELCAGRVVYGGGLRPRARTRLMRC
ncbi:MAG: ATP-binding cassette domain-containing protein [Gammaproteobacteria bacterium]|nr:ATP-binding cassette domain-containing protein [Gammaproteobacteria bacterium]MDE2252378.1 ATP-binding cassette domain-containing protein [Gammaproteobacteria bacterium]